MFVSGGWRLSPVLVAAEPPARLGGLSSGEVAMSVRLRSVLVSVLATMLLFAGMLRAPVAHAATFNVNTTGDGNDFDTMDGVCSINPPAQPVVCTLRAAVQ